MFGRIPGVRQRDVSDCGAACLLSVAKHYGKAASVARLRQKASTDQAGTNLLGLVQAATHLGFVAKGVRASAAALPGLPLPAIVHLRLDNGYLHYCALYRVRSDCVLLMDPADGRAVRKPLTEFIRQWTGAAVLIAPSAEFTAGNAQKSTAVRLWDLVQPHRPMLIWALIAAAVSTALGLSTAVYVRIVVDHVLGGGHLELLNLLGVVMLVLLGLQTFASGMKSWIGLRIGQRLDAILMSAYHRHLLGLPQRFFDTMRVGESVSRLADAVKIRALISEAGVEIAVNVLTSTFALALMLVYSWKLTLVVGIAIPLYVIAFTIANRLNRRHLRSAMERSAELESQLIESVAGATTVKQFGLQRWMQSRVEYRIRRLLDPIFHASTASIFTAQAGEVLARGSIIILFWVGAAQVVGGAITTGELLALYTLLAYLTVPASRLLATNRIIQDALVASDRLFEVLDLEVEEQDRAGEPSIMALPEGDIRFESVSFRYGNRPPVLKSLDLVLHHGETTALVGASGGGKTTILALLQKLHTVDEGRILIGDTDLRQIPASSLRSLLGVVPQDVHVLSASVIENVAMAEDVADTSRVEDVCREVGLHDLFESLPSGYATPLGDNGVGLSAGERQRLAIARALYRQARILLLDEATSNLDPEAEGAVESCLHRRRQAGVTIISICHRLDAAMKADRIIVIGDGRALEQGTHPELLRRRGVYHRMWMRQYPGVFANDHRGTTPLAATMVGADLP